MKFSVFWPKKPKCTPPAQRWNDPTRAQFPDRRTSTGKSISRSIVSRSTSWPTGQFVRERRDPLLLSPPGFGKSQIAQSPGDAALHADFNLQYYSLFELVRERQVDRLISRRQGPTVP